MRVLVISDWFPERPGDPAGSFVRAQALAVAARHEVAVLHLRDSRRGEGRPRLDAVRDGPLLTLRARGGGPPVPRTATYLVTALAALRRLRRAGFIPELVHAHEPGPGLAAVGLGRLLRCPVVISEHSSGFAMDEVHGVAAQVARIAFRAADVVCPVSEKLRAVLEQDGWPGRYRVVPNVVDVELFTLGLATPAGAPPLIVAVAALEPVKGVAQLVEAAGRLARERREFRIEIAGDGPQRAQLEARVDALRLRGTVAFRGVLPAADVAALMRRAAFAVVPSLWETFSVVLSEAMASGLPVVASDTGGMPERVHAGNGILCPPGDSVALSHALRRMLDHHGKYDRQAISEEARARFSPEAVATRWEEIYRGVGAFGPRSQDN